MLRKGERREEGEMGQYKGKEEEEMGQTVKEKGIGDGTLQGKGGGRRGATYPSLSGPLPSPPLPHHHSHARSTKTPNNTMRCEGGVAGSVTPRYS